MSRPQSRWLRLGFFQSIQPKMIYQPGKANIVADALSRSLPSAAKSEESAHQEQEDQDAVNQFDQAFTVTSSVQASNTELTAFKNAQQANPVLQTFFTLPAMELKRRNFELSPQGILVKVEDNVRRPIVPQEMCSRLPIEGMLDG